MTIIYENFNYKVEISDDTEKYNVINKKTDVTEVSVAMLPEALGIAEGLNEALLKFDADHNKDFTDNIISIN